MNTKANDDWKVEFYISERGSSPPLDYINTLPPAERAKIARFIKLLEQVNTRIAMPHARQLVGHKPLWELRPQPTRLIYAALVGKRFVILHAFAKKSNETPKGAIELAQQRYHELLNREQNNE